MYSPETADHGFGVATGVYTLTTGRAIDNHFFRVCSVSCFDEIGAHLQSPDDSTYEIPRLPTVLVTYLPTLTGGPMLSTECKFVLK